MKTMKQFKNLALTCKSPQEFYQVAKTHKDVPGKVSQQFADKYGHHHDPYKAAEAFYYDTLRANISLQEVKEMLEDGSWLCSDKTQAGEAAETYLNSLHYSIPFIRRNIDDSVVRQADQHRIKSEMPAPLEDFVCYQVATKIALGRLGKLKEELSENVTFTIFP